MKPVVTDTDRAAETLPTIVPEALLIRGVDAAGDDDIRWSQHPGLGALLAGHRHDVPELGGDTEAGTVVVRLDVDGGFDRVLSSPAAGQPSPDLVGQLQAARRVLDATIAALEHVTGDKVA